MADPATVNPQITDAVTQASGILEEGALRSATAIAFMEVAQSMVLAVQSGVTQLQSAFSLNVATSGAALARYFDAPPENLKDAQAQLRTLLEDSQGIVQTSIENLATLAVQASKALREFPSMDGTKPDAEGDEHADRSRRSRSKGK